MFTWTRGLVTTDQTFLMGHDACGRGAWIGAIAVDAGLCLTTAAVRLTITRWLWNFNLGAGLLLIYVTNGPNNMPSGL